MKLKHLRDYLSITKFEDVDLPNFTVLTGRNGAGKTQLLHAIVNGAVVTDARGGSAAFYDYSSFRLSGTAPVSLHGLEELKTRAANLIFDQNGTPTDRATAIYKRLIQRSDDAMREVAELAQCSFWDIPQQGKFGGKDYLDYRQAVIHTQSSFRQALLRTGDAVAAALYELQDRTLVPLITKTRSYIVDNLDFSLLRNALISESLARVFVDYQARWRANKMQKFFFAEGDSAAKFMSDEEFYSAFGMPPWQTLNGILEKTEGFNFRFRAPDIREAGEEHSVTLVSSIDPELVISVNDLSSGEQTLLALASSIWTLEENKGKPALVLLDEVDASLHPSMTNALMTAVSEVMLSRGIKVILATHSPSTVALAPAGSVIYLDRTNGIDFKAITNAEAVESLTEGFATLRSGLTLFEKIFDARVNIITEGRNARILRKGCELFGLSDVKVLSDFEGRSGKNQLKVLFDFVSLTKIDRPVVFVWDCDVQYRLEDVGNVHAFVIPANASNKLARKGIENSFAEKWFENLVKEVKLANGEVIREFDESCKPDFEERILTQGREEDFRNFTPLFELVRRL